MRLIQIKEISLDIFSGGLKKKIKQKTKTKEHINATV